MGDAQLSNSMLKKKEWKLNRVGCCEICKYDFKPILQVHHVRPISKGGDDDLKNLMLLCPNCHKAIHTIASESLHEKYSDDYIDGWLETNASVFVRNSYFNLSLKTITQLEDEQLEQIINGSQSKRSS